MTPYPQMRAAPPVVSRAAHVATSMTGQLARRASASQTIATGFATITDPADKSSSGLTPVEVGISLAVLFGAFIIVLLVGLMCKIFNKPSIEATQYVDGKLYQPSAAGYGTRSVMGRADPMGTPNFSSRVSLLGNAGPMGFVGGFDLAGDTSMASHDSRDTGDTSVSRGHSRGHSSGIQLPGATAAASRKGMGQGARHPTTAGNMAPDGSSFQPYSAQMERRPSHASTSAMPLGASAANQLPPHARVGLGPPPAADAKRRSRYARGASRRVDSMGPGTMRKSMYLAMEDDAMNAENAVYDPRAARMSRKFSDNGPSSQGQEGTNNLRRVDSVGKGDRRRSVRGGPSSSYTRNRGASIYSQSNGANGAGGDRVMLRSAQVDNFGAGRRNGAGTGDTSAGSIDPLNVNKGGYLRAPEQTKGRSGSFSSQGSNQGRPLSPSRQYSNQSSPGSQHSNASLVSSPSHSFNNANGASPYGTPASTPNSAAQAAAAAAGGYFQVNNGTGSPAMRHNRPRPGMAGGYSAAPYPPPQVLTTGPSSGRQII